MEFEEKHQTRVEVFLPDIQTLKNGFRTIRRKFKATFFLDCISFVILLYGSDFHFPFLHDLLMSLRRNWPETADS